MLISSCATCAVFDDRRGGKKKTNQKPTNQTIGFPINGKLKFFVNLYELYESLQAHSQSNQYRIAHIRNFKVLVS